MLNEEMDVECLIPWRCSVWCYGGLPQFCSFTFVDKDRAEIKIRRMQQFMTSATAHQITPTPVDRKAVMIGSILPVRRLLPRDTPELAPN